MEFKINNLERHTSNGVVTVVHWTVTKTDGDAVGSIYSSLAVTEGETVIPFEELTEEIVVEWVKASLDLVATEAALDAQITEQKTPSKASGLPWASV